YCALKINQGKTEYYRTVFEIFRILIDRHILLEEGRLSEGMYKNIITSGLRVNEYAWVESFIVEYSEFLPDQIRENARLFNLANLYSHQKMHDKVIELLQNVAYSDLVYALGAKMILLRTYYESREYIALDSLLDSVRIYVNRNRQLSRQTKREYLGFLSFLKKISSLRRHDREAALRLRTRIAQSVAVASKKWLLEKVDEFLGIRPDK
ncbi:MAG: hypothetical protein ACK4NS_13685, partial [Saprospiraceae bacterium]